MFYVITDFGTRHTGYRIGVHFQNAAGLTSGGLVYFSGLNVGSVDSIALLPDNTVDVILAVNRDINIPAESKFLIQAPLTGSPAVLIVPPPPGKSTASLAKQVLPVDQQPQGTNSATVADLLQQGQGEIKRLDQVMALLQERTPKLLNTLQTTLNNANELTLTARDSMQSVAAKLTIAGNNIAELSSTLNTTTTDNAPKVTALLDRLDSTSASLNRSMTALEGFATDPRLKSNLLDTTHNIADTTRNLSMITKDLRTVTGDPQTQAQMRNTVANLDATMQKANSLLGELGGTSNVYGVDAGATPAPPAVPGATPYPYPSGGATPYPSGGAPPENTAQTSHGVSPATRAKLQGKLASLARSLFQIQVRLAGLSPLAEGAYNPVITNNQGPMGDINVEFLPHSNTSFLIGANSIGNRATYNALLLANKGAFELGGGVLYSQIGVLGRFQPGVFGVETRVYDLTYPMIDLYGNFRIAPGATIFFGQRGINHSARRNTAGLQYQF
jgi:ABC-type transporter Mla subunit MlaD